VSARDPDVLVGSAMTAAGGLGLTVQIVTQFASLAAVLLNVVLAAGGLYLLWLRIQKAKRDQQ